MNNPTAGITAVILASGFSKRMGCNKLLLPVEGKAMIAHVFDAVRQVEFEQTVVVTGFDSIAQLAVGNGFLAVDNDSPEICLLYTSPSPRDKRQYRMPSSA